MQNGVTTEVLGVNDQLMRYLDSGGGNGRLGMVMTDFPGWALVDPAIWLVNADKTYVNSAYGYHGIKASNGKCLTVPYNNGIPPAAGTQLFWWGCESRWFSGNQMWDIIPTKVEVSGTSRTAYAFVDQWTGQCLAVDPATAITAGGKVTQDARPK
ncbi:hypothetical protein [Streptomyces sp. NPDC059631]|uniref:RICIN domain-containing protein n=1 Tax=unclassified Streptomyces TaxID=2593676 RepID=UPI00368341B2